MKPSFYCGILCAAVIAARACAREQSNIIYSVATYASGTAYTELCSLSPPFPPYQFKLTERSWYEDKNGLEIIDVYRQNEKGSVLRQMLEVQCGSNWFNIPLEVGSSKRAKAIGAISGTNGSGDLALLVAGCVTNRGGQAMVTKAPAMPNDWVVYPRETEDVIVVAGDHFAEVQRFLAQTCGNPDTTIRSSAPSVNVRSITYGPQQIGVMLNLTGDSKETVISVVGIRKP